MPDHHDVGELLTSAIVGKTLYSHSAASKGRLLKLFITEVGYTHTSFETEKGEKGTLATVNQGEGARNWEIIGFPLAKKVALEYQQTQILKKRQTLAKLEEEAATLERTYPTLDDHLTEGDPNPTITISSSTKANDGELDEFFEKRVPPEGFEYPQPGAKVMAMVNYRTSSLKGEVIPAGAIGTITHIRKAGSFKENVGYIGCGMFFMEVQSVYPVGLIIPWDVIGYFKIYS